MTLLEKIQLLFSAPVEINFKDTKLADGTAIRISGDGIIGDKVEIINTDGTLSVPTPGDLTLEDGTVISVDEKGLITEIETAQKETDEKAAGEEMADATATEPAPADAKPADNTSERIDAIEATLTDVVNALNLLIDKVGGQNEEMNKLKIENANLASQNAELAKAASAPAANFKKIEKTIHLKVDNRPTDKMLDRIVSIRESKNK